MKALLILLLATLPLAGQTPLETAKKLAKSKFDGWTWGPKASKKQVDCVQFVSAVIEAHQGKKLDPKVHKAVLIAYSFKDLDAAVAKEDPRTKGVQRALCELTRMATKIDAKDARPGDFVQYWTQRKSGKWAGHCAIISKLVRSADGKRQAILYGSHRSSGGIADSSFKLNLEGPGRKLYLCRLKK